MGDNYEKEVTKEFFLENLISRVISVKKRLDYLIFILVVVTCFGMYYRDTAPKKFILFELEVIDDSIYHILLSLILLVVYGIIGSHFIEYVLKRNIIDKELKTASFFKNKRWRNEYDKMNVEEGNEKLLIISSMIAPSSLYEFFYTLSLTSKNLRGVAPFVLLFVFLSSYSVGYIHIIQLDLDYYIAEVLGVLLLMAFFLLSREFVMSVKRIKEKLYDSFIKPLLIILIIYVLLLIAMRVVLI